MNLRDHDAPCKHGFFLISHQDVFDPCPGGVAVVVDYEAAFSAVLAIWPTVLSETLAREAARTAVDAALGLTDD